MDSTAPKRVAREAEQNTPFRGLARAGYAANGVVHILIGAIALVVAFGGKGMTDQSGALTAIATAPLGFALLWIIAITLCALGVWQILEGILMRAASEDAPALASKWGRRVGAWGQAAIFIALGAIAASVALGARVDAEEATENASRGLMSIPGGPIVLVLVGIGIGIGGIAFVVMGARRSFRSKIEIPEHGVGRGIAGLGAVGFIAKGVALAIVGILLVVASLSSDADTAGGLDGALRAILALTLGPWLVAAVGLGFIAYGLFCLFRARYAKLGEA
ncbi:protein of unknown function [Microbacterium sp. cf046]|uniref:DUF1206 domain-containing protein n=1 Tax=Microbacterium sp. cf046 TaxID=1761803 RepID=UPI0008F21B4B|nr:DUF1206 domain-containing protein [Microbacterium sp. cf046]SFS00854.1 protein of unknown function [Microbacterium sp. cf046]